MSAVKRHHFAVVDVLQPFENDRRVEAAGIGEHHFFYVVRLFFHCFTGLSSRYSIECFLVVQPGFSLRQATEQQKFHQCLLCVQSVLRFVPHDALRTVDHFGSDFLSAMRGQAMHEQRIGPGGTHHLGIHLPVFESALALGVLGFESHARPDVGRDEIGALHCLHGVFEHFVVTGAVKTRAGGLDFIAGRRGDVDVEIEKLGGLQPRIADVVRVADPRDRLASDIAPVLDESVDVAHDLARVILVREPVDDRNARMRREALDDLLLERADHDDVDHPADHARHVFDGLAAIELRVAGHEGDDGTAELMHAGFERDACARRLLLEHHGERAIVQRPVRFVALEPVLDPARAFEHIGELVAAEILELKEMPYRHTASVVPARA